MVIDFNYYQPKMLNEMLIKLGKSIENRLVCICNKSSEHAHLPHAMLALGTKIWLIYSQECLR